MTGACCRELPHGPAAAHPIAPRAVPAGPRRRPRGRTCQLQHDRAGARRSPGAPWRAPPLHPETEHAVAAVTTASIRLGGTTACLRRSVAALLYCRAARHTPVLVIGVRSGTAAVHAWLEADGRPAGEPTDPHLTYTPVVRYTHWEHVTP
ncbi:lasso peptide biosynthesis B2 protein [Streptomyces xiamenensis]